MQARNYTPSLPAVEAYYNGLRVSSVTCILMMSSVRQQNMDTELHYLNCESDIGPTISLPLLS